MGPNSVLPHRRRDPGAAALGRHPLLPDRRGSFWAGGGPAPLRPRWDPQPRETRRVPQVLHFDRRTSRNLDAEQMPGDHSQRVRSEER